MPPSRPEEGQMQARGEIVRVDEIPSGNAVEGIIVVEVGGVRGSGRGKVGKGYMADEMGKLRVGAPGSRGIRKGAESLTEMFDDVYQGETGGGRRQFEVAERRGRKDLHADTSAHGMSGDEKPFYPVSFLFRLPYHLRDLFENLFPHTQPHVQEERMHLPPIQVPSIGQAPLLLRILGVRPSVHLHLVRLGSFERQDHPPSDPKEYGLSPDRSTRVEWDHSVQIETRFPLQTLASLFHRLELSQPVTKLSGQVNVFPIILSHLEELFTCRRFDLANNLLGLQR